MTQLTKPEQSKLVLGELPPQTYGYTSLEVYTILGIVSWVEHRRTAQTPQQTVEYLLLVFRSSILNILNDAQAFGLSSPLSGEKE